MSTNNPLAKHFRQPSVYLKLPSQGKYWPEDSLELSASGDLPVYPMTTRDEIVLRTPDALLNGEGVISTIHSCCPTIKNAWHMPNGDIDAVLIAIRVASYGNEMEINSKCPHCENQTSHTVDLNIVLDRVRFPDYSKTMVCEGITIKLKPQSYEVANKANMAAFEEQKMLQNLITDNLEDQEKINEFNLRMNNLNDLNNDLLVGSTEYIETSDGIKVVNVAHIREFFENAQGKIVKQIKTTLESLRKQGELPALTVACDSCAKGYELKVEFDYARFFGND